MKIKLSGGTATKREDGVALKGHEGEIILLSEEDIHKLDQWVVEDYPSEKELERRKDIWEQIDALSHVVETNRAIGFATEPLEDKMNALYLELIGEVQKAK